MAWEKRMCTIERNGESKLEQKLVTPASWDYGIKVDVVVVVPSGLLAWNAVAMIKLLLLLLRGYVR